MKQKLIRQVIQKKQKLERTQLEIDQLERFNEKLAHIGDLFKRLKR